MEEQFERCLQALDAETAREYNKAVELAPELVENESSAWHFIRYEQYNLERAARRRAKYWKVRKYIFEERWLLPMTQTGTGALTSKEVEILRSGYICPVHTNTRFGLVVFLDKGRLPPDVPALQWQILMYIATIFQGHAGTIVNVVRTGDGAQIQRPVAQLAPQMYRMLDEALAYRNARYFVVQGWENGFERLLEFLSFQEMTLTRENLPRAHPILVTADSERGILCLLEESGFSRDCLPRYFGGNLDIAKVFNDWIRARIKLESVSSTPSRLNARQLEVTTAVRQQAGESKEDFIRRRSAFYSRRKYNKKSLKALTLEDEVALARGVNTELKQENQRLQDFLAKAQDIVERFHPNDGDKKPAARTL
eukprot:scaffold40115_cov183-Amphora_coffeaeformis.AAC.1